MSHDDRAALIAQAVSLFEAEQADKAEPIYQQVLASDPDNIPALIGAAHCASNLRRDAEGALAILDHALKVAPSNDHVHQSRAAILNTKGDFAGAVASARRAIELNPRNALAYVNLTESTKITSGDPLFAQAERTLEQGGLAREHLVALHFALGKAYQDCGELDRAFQHFASGNDLKPEFTGQANYTQVAERQKALYSPAFCAEFKGAVRATPRPIFIIGMPRSGTTLLERMLAAHPDVTTAGERPEMNALSESLYANALKTRGDLAPDDAIRQAMTRDNLTKIARSYITKIAKVADAKSQNIIDKMPANFWTLGLITTVFADAPILHMQRHPLDTGLSNYLANFRGGLDYSNRLDTLGFYYRLYNDLMDHWQQVRGDRILRINYETLVSDPEGETRRILKFCKLDWCDACVHPEDTQGVIATASRWQARQKINTASVQKWRRYEDQLSPLIDALGGWEWIDAHEQERFARTDDGGQS
ncbi:tetratricopeptide repeat-containing sulfotransferase family protein [Pseudooceanicola sp. MF1-13]|uniref:tetratricopeptide repeat-containing sulfotransferase family protein n=1 Tax=Pseudooceanicola sp. MF1-13 TaxID=3379095 RepID=UPI003891D00E